MLLCSVTVTHTTSVIVKFKSYTKEIPSFQYTFNSELVQKEEKKEEKTQEHNQIFS